MQWDVSWAALYKKEPHKRFLNMSKSLDAFYRQSRQDLPSILILFISESDGWTNLQETAKPVNHFTKLSFWIEMFETSNM